MVKLLHDGGFVHGDLQDVNMMTCHQWATEGANLLLLDFDWAGHKGDTSYPPTLNTLVGRGQHDGAKGGELIMPEHDCFMLDMIFASN